MVLLLMTWCCGDSQAERFEVAKGFCSVLLPKRRRAGRTVRGFQQALAKLPTRGLRGVAAGIRKVLAARVVRRWFDQGFVVMGCDGSRLECPRTTELERHLGQAGKARSAPTLWLTALVDLRLGLPWAWRVGKGTASERAHLMQMLPLLPRAALLVADAGYSGFELTRCLVQQKVSFLLRRSSNVTLYTEKEVALERYREGVVHYFPSHKQRRESPLRLRLVRVRARKKKGDVWLLTNVLDSRRLSVASAGTFYRWRWENEGQFRAYKRTLAKMKLVSRTVRLVHREAEGSLLALQLMLAQGVLALAPRRCSSDAAEEGCNPRKVLLAIRQEMYGRLRRGQATYYQRLQGGQAAAAAADQCQGQPRLATANALQTTRAPATPQAHGREKNPNFAAGRRRGLMEKLLGLGAMPTALRGHGGRDPTLKQDRELLPVIWGS